MVLDKLEEVKLKDPQIISGCWVDRDGITLAVYFSLSQDPKLEDEVNQSEEEDGVNQSEEGNQGNQNQKPDIKVWLFGTFVPDQC